MKVSESKAVKMHTKESKHAKVHAKEVKAAEERIPKKKPSKEPETGTHATTADTKRETARPESHDTSKNHEQHERKVTRMQVQEARIDNGQNEIDLLKLLEMYRRHLVKILLCFAVGMLVAGSYSYYCIAPLYKATAKLYMVSASSGSIVNLSDLNLGSSLSADYEELLMTRPVILSVIEELGLEDKYSYESLCGMISISTISSTRILKIVVTSTDPELSEQIANCLAEKGIEYLPEVMETTEPNMAERAIVPTHKSSPSNTKNALMGGMVGAVVCMGILTLLYLMDDTIKDAEDVEKFFGIMPLSVIPEGHMGKPEKNNKRGKKGQV